MRQIGNDGETQKPNSKDKKRATVKKNKKTKNGIYTVPALELISTEHLYLDHSFGYTTRGSYPSHGMSKKSHL